MTDMSNLSDWAAHQARHDGQPETRNAHDLLASLCQLAEENLAELRHLNARAAASESRSSAEIDSNGCAGRIKVKIKCYGESVEEARADAMAEFTRAMADIEQAQMAGWKATLDKAALADQTSADATLSRTPNLVGAPGEPTSR